MQRGRPVALLGYRQRIGILRLLVAIVDGSVRVARAVIASLAGYLGLLTIAAWVATVRSRGMQRHAPTGSATFCVFIPAHNEEQVLGATLVAARALVHPRYELHVVADHCTDRTVDIGRQYGVSVLEHDRPERGKGAALRWAMEQVDNAAGDVVVVVVDADTVVDPSMLEAFDEAFAAGAVAAQGHYAVLGQTSSTAEGLRAAALAARHHLRPLGRNAIGASSGLYGNGMAFRAAALTRHGFSDHLTEDHQLQLELLLDGVRVAYVPRACLAAEMPTTLEAAVTQNERWERGRIQLAVSFAPRLLREAAAGPGLRRRVALVDATLDLLVPPLSVLAASAVGVTAAGVVADVAARRRASRLGLLSCATIALHVVSALVMVRAPAAVYRSLLSAPQLVWWKTRLWARMLRPGRTMSWIRTPRGGGAGGL